GLHDGAQADGGVYVAGEVDVTGGPGVGPPGDGLEAVDDLDGGHLWSPGDGAVGEGGPEDVGRADVGTDLAGDATDRVHDVGIALDHHEVIDSHRAVFADSSQIVASQIHQHHVFRPLFGVGQQLLGELGVLFGSGP